MCSATEMGHLKNVRGDGLTCAIDVFMSVQTRESSVYSVDENPLWSFSVAPRSSAERTQAGFLLSLSAHLSVNS